MKTFLIIFFALFITGGCFAQSGQTQETKIVFLKPSKSSDISKEELSIERKVVITKTSEVVVNPKVRMIPKKYEGKGERVYINEEESKPIILEQSIIFKLVDDNGNEIKNSITLDEYKTIENKIRDYEKQKNINDRTYNVYIINTSDEVVSVTNKKK